MSELLGEAGLNRLRWRCRRGLLENDLFIERFFSHHEETITTRQAAVDTPDVREVLALMRCAPVAPRSQWSPQTT